MSYIGNPIVSTDFPVDYFSGNGSTTAFTLSIAPASVNAVDVLVSGVAQSPQTYTLSGTTLTFSAAPPSGSSNIVVKHRGIAGIPNVPAVGSVTTASLASQDLAINGVTVGKGANSVTGNTVLGVNALASASQSGTYGVAIGTNALAANTSGGNNVGVGTNALTSNTTGANNIAIGRDAAQTNSTGGLNVAIGGSALQSNTTGSFNTAVGYQSGYSQTTATSNNFVGYQSGYSTTTGSANNSFGESALKFTNTGGYNSAFGQTTLRDNTTGNYNTAFGASALQSNTTASNNTAVGYQAGYNNQTGTFNTFIGTNAGQQTTSAYNTFIGQGAGYYVSSGAKNTIIGGYSGNQDGVDIRTASNFICLSDGDGNLGARINLPTGGWYQRNNSGNWSTTSDQRIKENIVDVTNGLSVITALRPVEFDYKIGDKKHDVGFIAQEYQQVLPAQITQENSYSAEITVLTNGEPVLGINQNLVPYLVKAIQELNAKVEAQAAEIQALKGTV